jgi:hypothetical protein
VGRRVPKLSSQLLGLLIEYRNHPVVLAPPGFAEPLSVAELDETEVGAAVVVTGGTAGVAIVSTAPKAVPTELLARAQ